MEKTLKGIGIVFEDLEKVLDRGIEYLSIVQSSNVDKPHPNHMLLEGFALGKGKTESVQFKYLMDKKDNKWYRCVNGEKIGAALN